MFEVKLGTPKPVKFKEVVKAGSDEMDDVDLEARFAAKCEVSEYDKTRYADDEAVAAAIKENGPAIIEKCLKNYPEGNSKVRNNFYELDHLFDEELKNYGITAKTGFFSKALTEESESLYKNILNSIMRPQTDYGWDYGKFDTVLKDKPEGCYCVRTGLGFKFKEDRAYYMPGEYVEASFIFVATDTSYNVKVNAPDLKVEYGSVIKISFTMPDHDVDITMDCRSVMMNMPNKPMDGIGFMGMIGNMNNGNQPDRATAYDKPIENNGSEWTCPLCGSTNTGRFCCECGGAKPQQTTKVCECGYTGPFGKFCPNCGRAVEKEYTCQCGYQSKNAKFCPNCGRPTGQITLPEPAQEADTKPEPDEPLNPEDMLISISTYMSTNPPVNTYVKVYKHSDTQLLLDCNGKRRMIPADVLESAMEIIRKYRLDDPDFKDPSAMGIMGGSVYVGFKDGDRFVQTSLQTQGFAVTNAENELMGLFNKCK